MYTVRFGSTTVSLCCVCVRQRIPSPPPSPGPLPPSKKSDLDLLLRLDIFNLRNLDLLNLFLNGGKVNVGDFGVLAVKDLGHLFESDAASFDEEEGDEDEFEEEPALSGTINTSVLFCTKRHPQPLDKGPRD